MASDSEHERLTSPNSECHKELGDLKAQIELLKSSDPFRITDMAIELAIEKSRVSLSLNARDIVVQRLVDAYTLLRQKMAELEEYKRNHSLAPSPEPEFNFTFDDIPGFQDNISLRKELTTMEDEATALRIEVDALKNECMILKSKRVLDAPPSYEDDTPVISHSHSESPVVECGARQTLSSSTSGTCQSNETGSIPSTPRPSASSDSIQVLQSDRSNTFDSHDDPQATITARHVFLANLALPENVPEDILQPIVLPPSISFPEFLTGAANGPLRSILPNYRILPHATTNWCPQREEHGYCLTPLFKCITNPRVSTAHRWSSVDALARLNTPIECFYNNDGKWYYAGTYKAFRLDDLTLKEWEMLSSETSSALVKETLSGRKNLSPTNVYEASQLYACGALKIACIALQCTGFNPDIYHNILEQANQLRWKATIPSPSPSVTSRHCSTHISPTSHSFPPSTPTIVPTPVLPSILGGSSAWNAATTTSTSLLQPVGLGLNEKLRKLSLGVGPLSLRVEGHDGQDRPSSVGILGSASRNRVVDENNPIGGVGRR